MLPEYRYVGEHADNLEDGKPLGAGDFTGPIDPDLLQNAHLIEEGQLIEVPKGTYDKYQKALAQAEAEAIAAEEEEEVESDKKGEKNKEGDKG